ncbi:Flp pilus assembly pilin Flp [Arthrobacter sp. CAN_A214]|uniref:Flp family type IVb pilin n=1 Tax=Arthrobacter sp. CAN_A214 TaxID=2787720 RepID=UPI0018CA9F2E
MRLVGELPFEQGRRWAGPTPLQESQLFAHLAASLHTLGFTVQSRLRREETGATAVEYGIMVALIAVVLITAVTLLGGNLGAMFTRIAARFTTIG